jgi:thiamine biosynthesis lipoprotein
VLQAIKAALPFVDYKNISVSVTENTVTKNENTQISLGGIAKGYLGDELLEIAEEYGASALVSLGGNIVLCGSKSGNEKWSVGVRNPVDDENLACSFKCDGNKSVVTSGAYERYFEYGGKRYHHIIDPKTGRPAESELLSVTVIGENGTFCDAYSTALFVMGKEKSVAFAKEHNEFDFILITNDNEILITDGVGDIKTESSDFTVKSIQQ